MNIKQVVITGQNQVELQDLQLDEKALGADDILVETEYTFISAGTELANYSGLEPKVFTPGNWCSYPWKSGYANIGIVKEIGERVSQNGPTRTIKPGTRVFTYGPHASAHIYDTNRLAIEVPEGLDLKLAVASRMAGVAATAIHVAELGFNRWVAVFGLGTVGNLAAQMFRIMGCRVIGIDPATHRRELAEKCGIPLTVGGSPEEVKQAVRKITDGHMVDIAVDAVGDSRVVMECMRVCAGYGEIILLGTPRASVRGDLTELLSESHLRWVNIKGALEWRLPMYPPATGVAETQFSKQQMIFDWTKRGELLVEPLLSHTLKPGDIKQAYEGLLHNKEEYTGVVLDWRTEK